MWKSNENPSVIPDFPHTVIRWCQHNKEIQALKSEVKHNNTLIAAQTELLEEIARNAKVKPRETPKKNWHFNALSLM